MARNNVILGKSPTSVKVVQRIPSWNTPGRPEKAKAGVFGFNSQTRKLEFRNGSRWLKLSMKKI
jgi:hypothetical protein